MLLASVSLQGVHGPRASRWVLRRRQEATTRPHNVFTPSSSPRGRSEWIVEARRRNKLEKRINRCLAERQTDLPTHSPDTHTHTCTTAWLFFLGLYWIGMQSRGERRSEKDLAYKWCPLFDPLGWEGGWWVGWLAGGWGELSHGDGGKGWEANISVCESLPPSLTSSSSSEGGERVQLQEKLGVICFCWCVRGQRGYSVGVCVCVCIPILEYMLNLPVWSFWCQESFLVSVLFFGPSPQLIVTSCIVQTSYFYAVIKHIDNISTALPWNIVGRC